MKVTARHDENDDVPGGIVHQNITLALRFT